MKYEDVKDQIKSYFDNVDPDDLYEQCVKHGIIDDSEGEDLIGHWCCVGNDSSDIRAIVKILDYKDGMYISESKNLYPYAEKVHKILLDELGLK